MLGIAIRIALTALAVSSVGYGIHRWRKSGQATASGEPELSVAPDDMVDADTGEVIVDWEELVRSGKHIEKAQSIGEENGLKGIEALTFGLREMTERIVTQMGGAKTAPA